MGAGAADVSAASRRAVRALPVRRGLPDWREGGTSWTQDYPRADRHFATALRRLTRMHVRSTEQPVNPDDLDDFFNWPWMVAGEMGDWKLTDAQAKTLREYLLRGGFLYMDDFWGAEEYARFDESMRRCSRIVQWWRSRRTIRSSTRCTIWTTATRCRGGGRCMAGGWRSAQWGRSGTGWASTTTAGA